MRMRRIAVWGVGAVLSCIMPVGFCQSLSGSLSGSLADNTVLSGKNSSNTAQPGGVQPMVNSFVASTINADVKADVHADARFAVVGNTPGGSARAEHRIGSAVKGRVELAPKPDRQTARRLKGNPRHSAMVPARMKRRYAVVQPEQREIGPVLQGNKVRAGHSRGGIVVASYSADFADSTKGKAMVSPPDPGTASLLDWEPGLRFAPSDFAKRDFLQPSMHTTHSARRSGQQAAERKGSSATDHLRYDLRMPSLSTSIGSSLRTHPDSYDPLLDRD